MGKMVATVRFSFQGSRPSQLRDQRPGSGPPRGAAGAVGLTLHCRTYRGSLSGDAVSHGYGLATVSGERAWLCPQFPPLPEWLRPPPARGHPVSSRGRIGRHGAHKATKDRGRSRGLRREPVRAARRANLRCSNSFGAVALTARLRERQCQRQWRWRFFGLDQQYGNLDKLKLLGTITPWLGS